MPAASQSLLPMAYHELMTSNKSKIIDYYPNNFETDKNGKKQEWEAVVLIPFIDEVFITVFIAIFFYTNDDLIVLLIIFLFMDF